MKQQSLLTVSLASLFLTVAYCWNPALIIIDVQKCFVSGGSLAVKDGDDVVPVINRIRKEFFSDSSSVVVLSQDWHCAQHVSFASMHAGKDAFATIELKYLKKDASLCINKNVDTTIFTNAVNCASNAEVVTLNQTLWPDHCVKGQSEGPESSDYVSSLDLQHTDIHVRKGNFCHIDSYSIFFDNGGLRSTGLEGRLQAAEVDAVFVTGLALDYCVYYTAMDAKKFGFETYTVLDATRGVAQGTSERAKKDMINKGIQLINAEDIADVFKAHTNSNSGLSSTFGVQGKIFTKVTAFVCFIFVLYF